jgi:hypothetical protein
MEDAAEKPAMCLTSPSYPAAIGTAWCDPRCMDRPAWICVTQRLRSTARRRLLGSCGCGKARVALVYGAGRGGET